MVWAMLKFMLLLSLTCGVSTVFAADPPSGGSSGGSSGHASGDNQGGDEKGENKESLKDQIDKLKEDLEKNNADPEKMKETLAKLEADYQKKLAEGKESAEELAKLGDELRQLRDRLSPKDGGTKTAGPDSNSEPLAKGGPNGTRTTTPNNLLSQPAPTNPTDKQAKEWAGLATSIKTAPETSPTGQHQLGNGRSPIGQATTAPLSGSRSTPQAIPQASTSSGSSGTSGTAGSTGSLGATGSVQSNGSSGNNSSLNPISSNTPVIVTSPATGTLAGLTGASTSEKSTTPTALVTKTTPSAMGGQSPSDSAPKSAANTETAANSGTAKNDSLKGSPSDDSSSRKVASYSAPKQVEVSSLPSLDGSGGSNSGSSGSSSYEPATSASYSPPRSSSSGYELTLSGYSGSAPSEGRGATERTITTTSGSSSSYSAEGPAQSLTFNESNRVSNAATAVQEKIEQQIQFNPDSAKLLSKKTSIEPTTAFNQPESRSMGESTKTKRGGTTSLSALQVAAMPPAQKPPSALGSLMEIP